MVAIHMNPTQKPGSRCRDAGHGPLVQHCKTRLVVDGLRLIGHDSGAENENKAPSGIRRWLGLLPRNFVAPLAAVGLPTLIGLVSFDTPNIAFRFESTKGPLDLAQYRGSS